MILAANLMAMLIQYLSAKIGIATGQEPARAVPRALPAARSSVGLWVQAELIAMATDLAEFVGAAIALNLLFGVPLFAAGLITAVVAFGDPRRCRRAGYRRFETAIVGLLGVILLGFLYEHVRVGRRPGGRRRRPRARLRRHRLLLLATGILGATVMPHVIYLHSALTQNRDPARATTTSAARCCASSASTWSIAMGLAGLVNMSMLIVAASLFHDAGLTGVDTIERRARGLRATSSAPGAALAFALALLASGLSSSSVGTYAGQVVMQGFIRRSIPLMLRRG